MGAKKRRWIRAGAIAAAIVGALAVWKIAQLVGVDVRAVRRGNAPTEVEATDIVLVALFAGGLAWLALAVLERFFRLAVPLWVTGVLLVLAVVLVRTSMESQLTGGQRSVLCIRAVVLAACLVPALVWSSPRRGAVVAAPKQEVRDAGS